MQKKQLKPIPAGGVKAPKPGPPTAEDAVETEQQKQARDSERALDRALGRVPPG